MAAPENTGETAGAWRSPSSKPRRILVFRIGQLGDTIISLPAMQAIRRQHPDDYLTLLCDRHPGTNNVLASELLGKGGLFDDFLVYAFRPGRKIFQLCSMAALLATLRRKKFDTLVYLAPSERFPGQIKRDERFFRLAGIRTFIGMTNFASIPVKVPGKPMPRSRSEAELILDRLRADGIRVPPPGQAGAELPPGLSEKMEVADWLGRLPSDRGHRWIGVAPGSKMPAKRWAEERFRDVLAGLVKEFDLWPVVFGGKEDAAMGERLVAAWGCGYNAAGRLSLRGSAAALRHCAILLTNDTGTMHLGAAVGTRCVAVFSSRAAPGLWDPLGPGHHVCRSQIECEGCGLVECLDRKNECLQRITVEQVLAACRHLLKKNVEELKSLALAHEKRGHESDAGGQASVPLCRLPLQPGCRS